MPSQATSSFGPTTVGDNIRAAREQLGMTQRQVAEKIGTDSVLVSKWERSVHEPARASLFALASLFGHDVAWFYSDHLVENQS